MDKARPVTMYARVYSTAPLSPHFAGKGLIGYQPVKGYSNVWRMVVAGDVSYVTTADMDLLLEDMVAMAADL